jgi:alpha-tubulin suppressor-like RCC1 family protein
VDLSDQKYDIKDVSLGYYFMFVLKNSGDLYSIGYNNVRIEFPTLLVRAAWTWK